MGDQMSKEGLTEQEEAEYMLKLVSAINKFAFDIYKQLGREEMEENIFFSPASISFALAMTYLGARKTTATEMAETMHLDEVGVEGEHIHELFRLLQVNTLIPTSKDYVLHTANRLYAHQEYSFLQDFLDACQYYYNSELETVDFVKDPEGSRMKINRWVETMTNEKIHDLIPQFALTPLTRLLLVNAIYFKGDWEYQFEKSQTRKGTFHLNGIKCVSIQMMSRTGDFTFGHSEGLRAKVLELPYKGQRLSMFVFLPDRRHALSYLESNLTTHILINPKSEFNFQRRKVKVVIPKFKLESSFDLEETLPELGMVQVFDKGQSDLSGITENNDLFVSKVVHKAYLNVDEKGSEAAAATGVIVAVRSSIPQPQAEFIADRPFIFLIKDKMTGAILFMGRVTCPQSSDYTEPLVGQPGENVESEDAAPEDDRFVTTIWVDPDPACDEPLRFPSA